MSVYYCQECDKYIDNDWFPCEDWEGELVCSSCYDNLELEEDESMSDSRTDDIEAHKDRIEQLSDRERESYEALRNDEGKAAVMHRYDSEIEDSRGRLVDLKFYYMDYFGFYYTYNVTEASGRFLVMIPYDIFGIIKVEEGHKGK